MSYPPRPPVGLPGMPPMPPMMPPHFQLPPVGMIPMGMIPGPPIMPVAMTVAAPVLVQSHKPMKKYTSITTIQKKFEQYQPEIPKGPTVTVFVGNITDRASDTLIKNLLQKCGMVVNWKRIQGANGKLQAFGFCDYGDPEGALRAIRLLHDFALGERKLVVKVDAKTREKLDEYKADKHNTSGSEKPEKSDTEDDKKEQGEITDEELDPETKKADQIARNQIEMLIRDHAVDLATVIEVVKVMASDSPPKSKKMGKTHDSHMKMNMDYDRDPKHDLEELDLDTDKKFLIHREIDKFRDTYKALWQNLKWLLP